MRLFHRTHAENALRIWRKGFRDGAGWYGTHALAKGVWLSNTPLDANEGAQGDVLFRVHLNGTAIRRFEWIEEGKPYREWCVPAIVVNENATVEVVEVEPWLYQRQDEPASSGTAKAWAYLERRMRAGAARRLRWGGGR